jgi:hypothetical protein
MLSSKLMSTAAAYVLYMMRRKSPKATHSRALCRTLWYGEQQNDIARRLDFCFIFCLNKFKALNTLLNSAEKPSQSKEYFSFLCENLAWTQNYGVLSSSGGRDTYCFPCLDTELRCTFQLRGQRHSLFPLSLVLLCGFTKI